jgi:hypothetical protein
VSGPAPLSGWLGRFLGVESPPGQVPRPPAPPTGPPRSVGEGPVDRAAAVRRPVEAPAERPVEALVEGSGQQERPPAPRSAPPAAAARSARRGTVPVGVRRLLGTSADARIAVAAAEVLAPPRALRPYRGPGGR